MFRSTQNRGFQMVFANGWEISVQFGFANYSSARDFNKSWNNEMEKIIHEAETAEVAVFDADGEFYKLNDDFDDDGIRGWVSADEVARIIAEVAAK